MSFPHQLRVGIRFNPIPPTGIREMNCRKEAPVLYSLYPLQTFFVGIPKGTGFPIVQNEGPLKGPARKRQVQNFAVDLAAVHSRQSNQGSVTDSNGLGSDSCIGHFMARQF